MTDLPILYSFRRCPYAIRARMALFYAGIELELREVQLKNKPAAMLGASAKGTVPVLELPGIAVIDESLAVMRWALNQSDPDHWLETADSPLCQELIMLNDGPFKANLDRYKYADRHPEHPEAWYRDQAVPFLERLEEQLTTGQWLLGDRLQMIDVAIFPFIRQFAAVDRPWFDGSPFEGLQRWLNALLGHPLFTAVMKKHVPWVEGQPPTVIRPSEEHPR